MAPSAGPNLVPKAVHAIRSVWSRTSAYIRARLAGTEPQVAPIPVRQPIPRLAALRQSRARILQQQHRLFSTSLRRLGLAARRSLPTSQAAAGFPASATRSALARTTHAPFSSPLRPNLTGGALPRAAGGYGLGGGGFGAARHFSHVGSCQAQVVQNVHAAVRAFCVQGYRPVYAGTDPKTGRSRFRAVSATAQNLQSSKCVDAWAARGTSLDFKIAPTVTAVAAVPGEHADMEQELQGLAGDFARQLGDLAAVHADLRRLQRFGSLPLLAPDPCTLRVRFAGCDGEAVRRLCAEAGVTRGVVREDAAWSEQEQEDEPPDRDVEMALLFPWAPDDGAVYFGRPHDLDWRSMLSPDSPPPSDDHSSVVLVDEKLAASPASPFESVALSESDDLFAPRLATPAPHAAAGYEGVQGIYRFLSELEAAEAR